MKRFFLPSSLLLYVLSFVNFFIIGALVAKALGAGHGQGLAAAAIVLSYGVWTAIVAFIAAIVVVRTAPKRLIMLMNKILGALLFLLVLVIVLRFRARQVKQNASGSLSNVLINHSLPS